LLGSTPLDKAGAGAEDARLAPDGKTLWVVETGADALSAFAVQGGDLTALPGSTTLPTGAAPFGVVVI
jgi:DNA-binding beta-propeller fold protein YncE